MIKRRYLAAFTAVFLLYSCAPAMDSPKQDISFVATDNSANSQLPYFFYIPTKVRQNPSVARDVLVGVPGLNTHGEAFVDDKMKALADEENMVIIAPSFKYDGEASYRAESSYQFPAAWSGAALLRILDKVKTDEGLTFEKLYLFGISAGAQFVLRFSLLHPELCVVCVAHASGGLVVPEAKNDIKYFIGIGSHDIPDRLALAQRFVSTAEALGISVTYREYNEGHDLAQDQEVESLDFIKKIHQDKVLLQ